jgi:hypothetical protein
MYATLHLLFDICVCVCVCGDPPPQQKKTERENGSSYQYINPEHPLIGLDFSLIKNMPMSESVQPYAKI